MNTAETTPQAPSAAALAAAEEILNRRPFIAPDERIKVIAEIIDRHLPPQLPYQLENPLAEVCRQMRMRGGSFAQNLSSAMMAADPENLAIIRTSFPKIMERYDALATSDAQAVS